jgi:hypothetical protein
VEVSEQQEIRFELPVLHVKEEDFGPNGLPDDDDLMLGLGFEDEEDDLQPEEPLHPHEGGGLPDLIPKCSGDIDCEIPSHSKQGIFVSEPSEKIFWADSVLPNDPLDVSHGSGKRCRSPSLFIMWGPWPHIC